MTNKLRLSGISLTYLFGMIILLGSSLSAHYAPDQVWMTWFFSKLGGGDTLSSTIFNFSMAFAGLTVASMAYWVKDRLVKYEKASKFFFGAFLTIAVCFIGVSAFHFDDYRLVHDTFGYSMLASAVLLCLGSTRVMEISNKNYNRYVSLLAISSVALIMIYYVWHALSLVIVETIIFLMVYVWLILFMSIVSKLKDK